VTLKATAETGDRLKTLEELRDLLAAAIEGTESGRDIAALSLRLTDVLAQIADLAPMDEVDVVDEIAERRSHRRASASAGKARAKRSG
jgi:hypothetical protein